MFRFPVLDRLSCSFEPQAEAGERRHRRLDNAAHDVGCEEPGRGGNRGAECEQRATLRDRRQFADDGMADHVDDRGHGDADRERDIACMPGTYGMTAKARPPRPTQPPPRMPRPTRLDTPRVRPTA